jgi:phosphopantetheine--protein transferase-like protein
MIYGIGIDLVKIDRMKKAVEKWGENFLKRIFTEKEIAYGVFPGQIYKILSSFPEP